MDLNLNNWVCSQNTKNYPELTDQEFFEYLNYVCLYKLKKEGAKVGVEARVHIDTGKKSRPFEITGTIVRMNKKSLTVKTKPLEDLLTGKFSEKEKNILFSAIINIEVDFNREEKGVGKNGN
ncbi:hypothetical protein [Peribacillus frigoritolerans]|uniref:hypothetical protein n=1 Tax=Peribacillus frigoritolerans TaxID=450367 RepID=UPI0025A2F512|nr:hypothetical protein [Peribacillus frigoritolerans]MDM5306365.1 hypothetical protein [Peribacillus frigoritolerans]